MDILERRPELKAVLGVTGKEEEFQALVQNMSDEELVALNHHLAKALDDNAVDVWEKTRNVRKVENQIQLLKEDYKSIRKTLQLVQGDLRNSFATIYKSPDKAEQQCIQAENNQGIVKTSWIIKNRPNNFGLLKGISIFGLLTTKKRRKAKETAFLMNYAEMKKAFNEGKKMASWLGHIVKGA